MLNKEMKPMIAKYSTMELITLLLKFIEDHKKDIDEAISFHKTLMKMHQLKIDEEKKQLEKDQEAMMNG